MTDEDKEMRFGVVAVNRGFVTTEQIIEALNIQVREDIATGKHRKVGMILLEKGYMTMTQIDEVLNELARLPENTY